MTEKHVIGAERNFQSEESVGAATSTTSFIGTITTTDTPGKPLSVEINIDVSTAEGRKIWKSITLSPAAKTISVWAAGTTLITYKPFANPVTRQRLIDSVARD